MGNRDSIDHVYLNTSTHKKSNNWVLTGNGFAFENILETMTLSYLLMLAQDIAKYKFIVIICIRIPHTEIMMDDGPYSTLILFLIFHMRRPDKIYKEMVN